MVRRVGGAYGGKCSRSMPVAAAAALAARLTGRRTRLTLNRNDDMRLNGGALSLPLRKHTQDTCRDGALPDVSITIRSIMMNHIMAACLLRRNGTCTALLSDPVAVDDGIWGPCCGAGRSETMVEYDVGFDSEGKISALKIRGYFLCGADMDLGAQLLLSLPANLSRCCYPCQSSRKHISCVLGLQPSLKR